VYRHRCLPAKRHSANGFPPGDKDLEADPGTANGEWRYYGGDAGSTKYSPLDQINAKNVKRLEIVWRWKAENFGPRPDYNWEVTPGRMARMTSEYC
jgi:glucose dehydrogenase